MMTTRVKLAPYRGYRGSAMEDASGSYVTWVGKIDHIRDAVLFETDCEANCQGAFEDAVDEYLEDCASEGVPPESPHY